MNCYEIVMCTNNFVFVCMLHFYISWPVNCTLSQSYYNINYLMSVTIGGSGGIRTHTIKMTGVSVNTTSPPSPPPVESDKNRSSLWMDGWMDDPAQWCSHYMRILRCVSHLDTPPHQLYSHSNCASPPS